MDLAISKFAMVFIGILIATVAVSIPYLKSLDTIENKIEIKIRDQFIVSELAKNALTRSRGLSGRQKIGINEGMLFEFSAPGRYSFWMRNMKFPIDIIWIDENKKIIGITENIDPQIGVSAIDLKAYYPPESIKWALELKAGRAKILRAENGDSVQISPFVKK